MKGVNPMDCVKFYETGDATCVTDLSLGLCGGDEWLCGVAVWGGEQ